MKEQDATSLRAGRVLKVKTQLGNMTKEAGRQSSLRTNGRGEGRVSPLITSFPVETCFFKLFSSFPMEPETF